MEQELADAVEFGPFRFEPARRILSHSGSPVRIGDRAFDILRVLIAHAPNVVTKQILLQEAWAGVFVDEANLRFNMVQLRKALGDGADNNRYIATVVGRGYCFVAPLSRSAGAGSGSTTEDPGPAEYRTAEREPELPGTNLPRPLTNILGRDEDLVTLQGSIGPSRLVTLTGPGGVGKTRLAIELGWQALERFPGGVWLIDLAPISNRDQLASATATALGVNLSSNYGPADAIATAIRRRQCLLIFDNCEHVVRATAELIEALLMLAPDLYVVTTSQEALGIAGEQIYRVNPLRTPPEGKTPVAGYGAMDLFIARARAADEGFELHDGICHDVAEICRHLDGLPLALEMAAMRVRTLGVEGLRAGLDERLRMLKGTPRSSNARHASLRAVLEWSHGLLEPQDRQVFRRLAIFPGSFSLEAAIAIASENGPDRWDIAEALSRLVDKSLVTVESRGPHRYRLLETLRLYATEQLNTAGEADLVPERHALYFLDFLDGASKAWETMPDAEWISLYRPEIDNLRAALDWALADPVRRQIAIALAGTGAQLLNVLSLRPEGRAYMEKTIPLICANTPPATAARLLKDATAFWQTTDFPRVMAYSQRAAALYRDIGDSAHLGTVLGAIGVTHGVQGRHAEAETILTEAWEMLAGSALKKSQQQLTSNLGTLALFERDYPKARHYFTRALDLARALKSLRETTLLLNLSVVDYALGDIARAVEGGREAVACARRTAGQPWLGNAMCNLAGYLLEAGSMDEARGLLEEAIAILVERGTFDPAECFTECSLLAAVEGRHADAARMLGFFEKESAGIARNRTRVPTEEEFASRTERLLEAELSPAELRGWKAEGARWTEADAIEFITGYFQGQSSPGLSEAG